MGASTTSFWILKRKLNAARVLNGASPLISQLLKGFKNPNVAFPFLISPLPGHKKLYRSVKNVVIGFPKNRKKLSTNFEANRLICKVCLLRYRTVKREIIFWTSKFAKFANLVNSRTLSGQFV